MKWKLLLLSILTSAGLLGYGQTPYNQQENFLKANSVWAFGLGAGVDFNMTSPTGIETNTTVWEGTASVADPVTGQLLFYSDGNKCWDASHQLMPNGDSLWGNKGSTTQGVCIVPVIDSPEKYYLFSLCGPTDYGADTSPAMLAYSIVDMSLEGGMGDIVNGQKNIILSNDSLAENIVAIPGDNCDIWLMVHEFRQPVFRAYHITSSGLDTVPVISNAGGLLQGMNAYYAGQMAVSPDRSRIAITSDIGGGFEIGALMAQFNGTTGEVSDALTLTLNESCRGVCFSPDNSKLYVNGRFPGGSSPFFVGHIRQYDISIFDSTAIVSSARLIDSSVEHLNVSCLKLYDGKIYRLYSASGWAGLTSSPIGLSVINAPNLLGTACDYDTSVVVPFFSGTTGGSTLPNDVVYPLAPDTVGQLLLDTAICGGVTFPLEASSSFSGHVWDDGSTGSIREVSQSGTYWVLNTDRCHSRVDTFVVEFYDFITPVISVDGFVLRTTASYANYQWLLNGVLIAGATQSEYTVLENGDYQVIVTTADGCTDTSAIYEVNNVSIAGPEVVANQITIYPNPATEMVYIKTPVPVDAVLCSMEGKTLKYSSKALEMSVSDVASGVYLLKVYDFRGRLIKTEKIIKPR